MKSISKQVVRKRRWAVSTDYVIEVSGLMLDAVAAMQRPVSEEVIVPRAEVDNYTQAMEAALYLTMDKHPSWHHLEIPQVMRHGVVWREYR